jgi:hypothetical protein
VDGAAFEIPIDRRVLIGGEFLVDLPVHGLEGRLLGREVLIPIGFVELFRAELGRRVDVPEFERWAALRDVDADREQRERDHDQQHRRAPQEPQ